MQPGMQTAGELPTPDEESRRHSERVRAHIEAAIAAGGGNISFAEFMHLALYAPGLGYYSAGARKFGRDGDFITAPEVSPLFGHVVARASAPVLQQLSGGEILELGAGSGALAVSMLGRLAELDALPDRYLILEVSPDLAERQREAIGNLGREFVARVEWLDSLPQEFCGVVIANEVADALPVERFTRTGGELMQYCVTNSDDGFAWQTKAAPRLLRDQVQQIERELGYTFPDDYRSEFSPGLGEWIGDIADRLSSGLVFLFDYGVARSEYYALHRRDGWLRCFFRHHIHDDPLILPGIQDLSAWVDFTSIAQAASSRGLVVDAYLPQARFLMHNGLEDELRSLSSLSHAEQLELSRQVKLLTLPGEMGEHFKYIAMHRGEIEISPALCAGDRAHVL